MERLKRGTAFWGVAWRMAREDPALLRPMWAGGLFGVGIILLGAILIAGSVTLLGGRSLFPVLTGFLLVLLVLALLATGFIFSAQTIFLVFNRLERAESSTSGALRQAGEMMRRDWPDYLALAGAIPAATAASLLPGRNGSPRPTWTDAAGLVLPVMVIEDAGLRDGLDRAETVVREALLPEPARRIGIGWVSGLVAAGMGFLGLLAGAVAGLAVMQAFPGRVGLAGGITVWVLLAGLLFLPAVLLGSYVSAAYQATQYRWARDVEVARSAGQPEPQAPDPLAAVLNLSE